MIRHIFLNADDDPAEICRAQENDIPARMLVGVYEVKGTNRDGVPTTYAAVGSRMADVSAVADTGNDNVMSLSDGVRPYLSWHSVEAYSTKGKAYEVIALFRYESEALAYTQRHNGDGGIKLRCRPAIGPLFLSPLVG